VGPNHLLLLNIYAFYRPSLLLITRRYVPQEEALDDSDLTAAWAVLQNFPRERYFLIYNCGYNSGSSQGHKHMQLWPYPNEKELGFELFTNQAQSETVIAKDIANVPLKHFVLRLPANANATTVIEAHRRLLQEVRQIQQQTGSGPAHNVIISKDWICLIPRRHSGFERGVGVNSAGVLGLAWAVSQDEKNAWVSIGAAELLRFVGIPVNA
jgi:ATP adenylyltransferase